MIRMLWSLKVFLIGLGLGALVVLSFQFGSFFKFSYSLPDLFNEQITDKFYAYATQITGKQSLYVAKLQQVEVLERTSMAKALWFDLPNIVLKIEVPVEYNYYVPIHAGWKLEYKNDEIWVTIPHMTNSTPALDISKLKLGVKEGSVLRNESSSLKRFQNELPSLLMDRALAHRELIRDQARESVSVFIKTWLEQVLGREVPNKIHVRFVDEGDLSSASP